MKNGKHVVRLALLALSIGTVFPAGAHDRHAPLNTEQVIFMKQYEIARAALARNDLKGALAATRVIAALTVIHHESSGIDAPPGFVQDARKLILARDLGEAREIFKSYSRRAINVGDLKPGFYVVHCASYADATHDWVESSLRPGNPYTGDAKSVCP